MAETTAPTKPSRKWQFQSTARNLPFACRWHASTLLFSCYGNEFNAWIPNLTSMFWRNARLLHASILIPWSCQGGAEKREKSFLDRFSRARQRSAVMALLGRLDDYVTPASLAFACSVLWQEWQLLRSRGMERVGSSTPGKGLVIVCRAGRTYTTAGTRPARARQFFSRDT